MKIAEIVKVLEQWASPAFAEDYDNVGLITGHKNQDITGILICLDSIEQTIEEAIKVKANLIIAHHPILFRGLKKINGNNYVERTLIRAIKQDIAIYAIHTNLDNINTGVNKKIADKLGLYETEILLPKEIGSFSDENTIGSGIIGRFNIPMIANDFFKHIKSTMAVPFFKHTAICKTEISKIAVCGGSGSFLIAAAIHAGVDAFITADLKYHEFFDADSKMILVDIGHFESEQYTIDLIAEFLKNKVSTIPIFQTRINTNPVQYFI